MKITFCKFVFLQMSKFKAKKKWITDYQNEVCDGGTGEEKIMDLTVEKRKRLV